MKQVGGEAEERPRYPNSQVQVFNLFLSKSQWQWGGARGGDWSAGVGALGERQHPKLDRSLSAHEDGGRGGNGPGPGMPPRIWVQLSLPSVESGTAWRI